MSDGTNPAASAPTPAPSPAPAAPAPAPSPAAPAPAPTFESLIHDAPGATPPAPAPAPGAAPAPPAGGEDPFAALLGKVPEKFHVKGDGDKLDPGASLAKALEHRDHLEKRLGAGDIPPKTSAEYAFTPPDEFKDLQFDQEKTSAFKDGAHKLGFTQAQYEFAMKMHLESVPSLMEGAATLTATQARAELQKVWSTNEQLESGITNAKRAIRGLPPALQEATRSHGTDPAFLQAMAYFGSKMREDTPANTAQPPAQAGDVQALMRSEAYTNAKHPQHAAVSKQVADFYGSTYGKAPV